MKISLDRSDFTPKIWVTGVKITRKIQFTGVIYRSDNSHSCHFDIPVDKSNSFNNVNDVPEVMSEYFLEKLSLPFVFEAN